MYDPPEERVQGDWHMVMRARQLATWTGESLYSVLQHMSSNDRQERDTTRKLYEWMDIHHEAAAEYKRQVK